MKKVKKEEYFVDDQKVSKTEFLLHIIKKQKFKLDMLKHEIAGLTEENESARKLIKKYKIKWLYS